MKVYYNIPRRYKLVFTTILVFCSHYIFGQTTAVKYTRKANIEYQLRNVDDPSIRESVKNHLIKNEKSYELLCRGKKSIYKELLDGNIGKPHNSSVIDASKSEGYYKDVDTRNLVMSKSLNGQQYLVVDMLPDYEWNITKKTKTILGHHCSEAIAKRNGEKISAWFTKELPIHAGPMEFWIEEGLILELVTNAFTTTAYRIERNDESVIIEKPSSGLKVTMEKYNKIKTEFLKSIGVFDFNDD